MCSETYPGTTPYPEDRTIDGIRHRQCRLCKRWLPLTVCFYLIRDKSLFMTTCSKCLMEIYG